MIDVFIVELMQYIESLTEKYNLYEVQIIVFMENEYDEHYKQHTLILELSPINYKVSKLSKKIQELISSNNISIVEHDILKMGKKYFKDPAIDFNTEEHSLFVNISYD